MAEHHCRDRAQKTQLSWPYMTCGMTRRCGNLYRLRLICQPSIRNWGNLGFECFVVLTQVIVPHALDSASSSLSRRATASLSEVCTRHSFYLSPRVDHYQHEGSTRSTRATHGQHEAPTPAPTAGFNVATLQLSVDCVQPTTLHAVLTTTSTRAARGARGQHNTSTAGFNVTALQRSAACVQPTTPSHCGTTASLSKVCLRIRSLASTRAALHQPGTSTTVTAT